MLAEQQVADALRISKDWWGQLFAGTDRGAIAREFPGLRATDRRAAAVELQNNLLVNPDYTRAIARIVSAVAPYTEAPESVIAELRDLDAASAATPHSSIDTAGSCSR
jgi:hypothetical protein